MSGQRTSPTACFETSRKLEMRANAVMVISSQKLKGTLEQLGMAPALAGTVLREAGLLALSLCRIMLSFFT